MILRTITCSVKGCNGKYTETAPNDGFPGWIGITGIQNPDTKEEGAHVCPVCKAKVYSLLNGGE